MIDPEALEPRRTPKPPEKLLGTLAEDQQYIEERVAQGILDQLLRYRDAMVAYYTRKGGRTVFERKLTTAEQLQRWMDPIASQEVTRKIMDKEGPKGVSAYIERMSALQQKEQGNGQ